MYREGSLERDLTIWTFRFVCMGMLKQIFSAEILKTSSIDVTQTNGRFLHVIYIFYPHLAMTLGCICF